MGEGQKLGLLAQLAPGPQVLQTAHTAAPAGSSAFLLHTSLLLQGHSGPSPGDPWPQEGCPRSWVWKSPNDTARAQLQVHGTDGGGHIPGWSQEGGMSKDSRGLKSTTAWPSGYTAGPPPPPGRLRKAGRVGGPGAGASRGSVQPPRPCVTGTRPRPSPSFQGQGTQQLEAVSSPPLTSC